MTPDTLVALPPITAAQRQLLIAVLEHARSQGYPGYAERVIGLAHALDLHRDAVRAEPRIVCEDDLAGNAAPGTTVRADGICRECGSAPGEQGCAGCVD